MEFEWDLCPMCGPHIKCPKCGNNCCNATYGVVDGTQCDVCPLCYQHQALAWQTFYKKSRGIPDKFKPITYHGSDEIKHWQEIDPKTKEIIKDQEELHKQYISSLFNAENIATDRSKTNGGT